MGWKTIAGALVVAMSAALRFLESQSVCQGCSDMADGIEALGIALIGVGLRHAIKKTGTKVGT